MPPDQPTLTRRPARPDVAEYFLRYIELAPSGDILEYLHRQGEEALDLLGSVSDERSLHRYATGKWSIRDMVNHVTDTERVFAYRALWFARGFEDSLPSFDQNPAAMAAEADQRPWGDIVEEFRVVRASTVSLVRSLPSTVWDRRGIASGESITVRGLVWLIGGHCAHHLGVLRERYL